MINSNQYGNHRCLEPKNSFPDYASKLDNTMKVLKNEILIETYALNFMLK